MTVTITTGRNALNVPTVTVTTDTGLTVTATDPTGVYAARADRLNHFARNPHAALRAVAIPAANSDARREALALTADVAHLF